jgi:hypothetical protein
MTSNMVIGLCVVVSFVLGYLAGRIDRLSVMMRPVDTQPASFLKAAKIHAAPKAAVSIDDTKYVAPISTEGLSRTNTATTIGKTTQTQDDIQMSVSKLAQLKGK